MEDNLELAELTKNESKTYTALYELGSSTAYSISRKSKLYHANTYAAIQSLVKKGLAFETTKDNKKIYTASDPVQLLNLIDEKRQTLLKNIEKLHQLREQPKTEGTFSIAEGQLAFISILYKWLEFKEPILTYGVPKNAAKTVGPLMDEFHMNRIRKKVTMYHIYNYDASERINIIKHYPYTPIRKLSRSFNSAVATNICGDEIMFILWSPKIKAFLIKNKEMTDAYKKYFE